jgi:hypothetical protein
MKKIYLIKLKEYGYDEYDGWIVIADNEEEVLKLCEIKETEQEVSKKRCYESNRFKDNIEEIKFLGNTKIKESQIVLSSYNAG